MRLQQLMLMALLIMSFVLPAHAEETISAPEQSTIGGSGEWGSDHMARQEYREEMEKIRDEHEQLESEHDALKTQCMNAKGQERSACRSKWQDLRSRKDALHERMKTLHEKMVNDDHHGNKSKNHVQAAPAAQPQAAPQQ